MTPLQGLLTRLGACTDALEWCGEKTLREAWATCERGDWMLWLAVRMGWLDRPALIGYACDCAERVLPTFEVQYPGDSRPRVAIETARRWVLGEATIEECRSAAAVSAAAYAADAAVYDVAECRWQADRMRDLYTPEPLEGEE